MSLPLSLLFGKWQQFTDDLGAPLANGSLKFFIAGTTTPQAVYADSDGMTSLGTTVDLNGAGRPSSGSNLVGVYLLPTGYKVNVYNQAAVLQSSTDDVEDVGSAFLADLANIWATGSKSVTTGYTVADSDNWVSVSEPTTNPAILNLPAAASRGGVLFVQNIGPTPVSVTPNGSETINSIAGAYALPIAASPVFPALLLLSDGVSNWLAFQSLGAH
jgi:hypothetical protein